MIVDNILTLSKLDANLLTVSPEKVQLLMLVRSAMAMLTPSVRRADLQAHICLDKSFAKLGIDYLILDPNRFLQVTINLLTNAIKLTRDAAVRNIKVCLSASYQKPSVGCSSVCFLPLRLADSSASLPLTPLKGITSEQDIYLEVAIYSIGEGFTPGDIRQIFDSSFYANPKTHSHYDGSSLGFFISHRLCEMQGGQIGMASNDAGTVFAFFIKAKQ
jgi:signal transduction histidine kinase